MIITAKKCSILRLVKRRQCEAVGSLYSLCVRMQFISGRDSP